MIQGTKARLATLRKKMQLLARRNSAAPAPPASSRSPKAHAPGLGTANASAR